VDVDAGELTYHVPDAATRRFEAQLGALYAEWPCAKCGKPMRTTAWRQINKRYYHPACYAVMVEGVQRG
jgi:predicted RNA-binding Zn-ribbon protein involved in translation (DUF1610 family)